VIAGRLAEVNPTIFATFPEPVGDHDTRARLCAAAARSLESRISNGDPRDLEHQGSMGQSGSVTDATPSLGSVLSVPSVQG
jgi:hypothetical protein